MILQPKKHKSRGLQTMDDTSESKSLGDILHIPPQEGKTSAGLPSLVPLALPCKTLTTPCCLPDLDLIWPLRTCVHYLLILLCDVVTDSFWVITIVIRLVWILIKSALTKAKWACLNKIQVNIIVTCLGSLLFLGASVTCSAGGHTGGLVLSILKAWATYPSGDWRLT